MINARPAIYVLGWALALLGIAMLVVAGVDGLIDGGEDEAFLDAGAVTIFCALLLVATCRPAGRIDLTPHQAALLPIGTWTLSSIFGALPFVFATKGVSLTDGFFEAMSGLTTTGATIFTGLDDMPPDILLWRSLLHWLGGFEFVVMAVAILPILRIGGMQLFRMESSKSTEKAQPRMRQMAIRIMLVYIGLTTAATVSLWLAGMTFFESVNHAMSAISTGGYSTSDSSAGNWNDPVIHWVLIFFMASGGVTLALYAAPARHGRPALFADTQFLWYLGFLGFFSLLFGFWLWGRGDMAAEASFRHGAFTVVSVVTTTGFASTDWGLWTGFPLIAVFLLTFVGGCTGSTAGGIKIFRFQVLFKMSGVQVKRLLHPRGIHLIFYNGQNLPDAVVRSVLGFALLYALSFAMLTVGLAACNLDFVTCLTGAATSLGNVGPGLGGIIGPSGTYQSLPDAAKWILSIGMLLGRVEVVSALVLLTPSFWRG